MTRTIASPETLEHQNAGTALRSAYHKLCWDNDFEANGRAYWREYDRQVRELARPEEVLVFELGEGWERLCGILGKEVPEVEYPNKDEHRSNHDTTK